MSMLICLQFPFADSRRFLDRDTYILDRPTWPSPDPNSEFVRHFGSVRKRGRGGVRGWVGENEICEAQNAFRFQGLPIHDPSGWFTRPHVAFRRLFFDGLAVGKIETGLAGSYFSGFDAPTSQAIRYVLHLPVKVKLGFENVRTCELGKAGKFIVQSYVTASTRKAHSDKHSAEPWWVMSGQPLLFIYWNDSYRTLSFPSKPVPIPDHYGFRLYYSTIHYSGKRLPTWIMGYGRQKGKWNVDLDAARTLRLYLLRLHAEHVCLRLVLRNIEKDRIPITRGAQHTEFLQYYLNIATRRIKRWESKTGDLAETCIADVARASEDFISPGQRDAILNRLEIIGIRKNVLRKIEEYAGNWINFQNSRIEVTGGITMGDTYKVSGQIAAVGPNSHVHDINFNQIWNQLKESVDLSQLADELGRLRIEMKKEAIEPEQDIAVSEIAQAEQAAKMGDGSKTIQHIKSAGKWALDVATKIGSNVAVEVIKKSLGG